MIIKINDYYYISVYEICYLLVKSCYYLLFSSTLLFQISELLQPSNQNHELHDCIFCNIGIPPTSLNQLLCVGENSEILLY